jgi:hypothetical protein
MGFHTELQIYQATYGLLDFIMELVKNMPRDYKQHIGGKLRDIGIEATTLIFRANVARDKVPHLDTLIERLQEAELLLRLSRDKRLISTGQYSKDIEMTRAAGKQAGGWRRQQRTLSPAG